MAQVEKAYSTKEISLTLDIGESTLRKWCLALEKQGYKFIKNDREQRLFVDRDLVTLRHFYTLVKDHNMQLDNASMVVVDRFGKGAFEPGTGVVHANSVDNDRSQERSIMQSPELFEKLMSHIEKQEQYIEKQEQFNQELLKRLDEQQQYIETSLKSRDETLMQSLREMQETRKLLAASEEEREKEKKSGFLSRLFKK